MTDKVFTRYYQMGSYWRVFLLYRQSLFLTSLSWGRLDLSVGLSLWKGPIAINVPVDLIYLFPVNMSVS